MHTIIMVLGRQEDRISRSHSKFKATLSYLRLCLQKKKDRKAKRPIGGGTNEGKEGTQSKWNTSCVLIIFLISVTTPDRSKLRKKGLIWACGSRSAWWQKPCHRSTLQKDWGHKGPGL